MAALLSHFASFLREPVSAPRINLKPEIEARVGRLFRWHIDPAPLGLWIDRIDERGRSLASDVPASIFYHLVCALTQYLDGTVEKSG